MNAGIPHPLSTIMEECARSAPAPWYPATYAREAGIARDLLDPHLDRLRLGGLVRLTDWVQGLGQGYELTDGGKAVMASPRLADTLRRGELPTPAPDVAPDEPDVPAGHTEGSDRTDVIERAFRQEGVPYVCWSIIWVNVAVFLFGGMLASRAGVPLNAYADMRPNPAVLAIHHELGSLSSDDVFGRGQWWRLVTCCFVHVGGLLHIASNMYMLYLIGPLLERLWGHWQFAVLYLVTGFAGSCGMLIEHQRAFNGGGASGAIWGVMASLATWLLVNRRWVNDRVAANIWRSLLNVLIMNLAVTFLVPNVSKGAHFGGGIAGLIVALPLDFLRFGGPARRAAGVVSLLAIVAGCVGLTFRFHDPHAEGAPRAGHVRRDEALVRLNEVVKLCATTWRETEPIVNRPPLARDAADIEAALAELDRGRARIAEEITDIGRPAADNRFDAQAFTLAAEVAERAERLFEVAGRCLRSGKDWSDRDQKELAGQKAAFRDAVRLWLAHFADRPAA